MLDTDTKVIVTGERAVVLHTFGNFSSHQSRHNRSNSGQKRRAANSIIHSNADALSIPRRLPVTCSRLSSAVEGISGAPKNPAHYNYTRHPSGELQFATACKSLVARWRRLMGNLAGVLLSPFLCPLPLSGFVSYLREIRAYLHSPPPSPRAILLGLHTKNPQIITISLPTHQKMRVNCNTSPLYLKPQAPQLESQISTLIFIRK